MARALDGAGKGGAKLLEACVDNYVLGRAIGALKSLDDVPEALQTVRDARAALQNGKTPRWWEAQL